MSGALRLILLVGLLGAAAHGLAPLARLRLAERLLALFVVAAGLLVGCGLLLGAAVPAALGWSALRWDALCGALALLVLVRAFVRWRGGGLRAAGAGIAAPFRELAAGARAARRLRPRGVCGGLAAGAAALGLGYAFLLGWIAPPSTGDGLMHHLMIATSYVMAGRIVVPELTPYWHADLWAWFPGNGYLLQFGPLAALSSDRAVFLVAFVSALAGALATYALARRLGAGASGGGWAATLWCAIPIVVNQSRTELVDLPLAALTAAGLVFLLVAGETGGPGPLVLAAVAAGVALGVKPSGLVYWALIGAAATALLALDGPPRRLRRRVAAASRALIALILGGAALAGFWFVRNAVERGHPLFPSNIVLARERGPLRLLPANAVAPLVDQSLYGRLHNYESGVGPMYAAFALPAALALALRRARRGEHGAAVVLLLLPALHAFWIVALPASYTTVFRYVAPALPLGLAAFGVLLDGAAARPRCLLLAAAGAAAALAVWGALPAVGSFTDTDHLPRLIRAARQGAAPPALRRANLLIHDHREAWRWVDANLSGKRIAIVHTLFPQPLRGPRLSNEIVVVPPTDERTWLDELKRREVDVVAVVRLLESLEFVARPDGGFEIRLTPRPPIDPEQAFASLAPPAPAPGVASVTLRYAHAGPAVFRLVAGLNGFRTRAFLPPTAAGEVTLPCPGATLYDLSFGFLREPAAFGGPELSVQVFEVRIASTDPMAPPLALRLASQPIDGPLEWWWIKEHPERFRLLYGADDYWGHTENTGRLELYEVRHGR